MADNTTSLIVEVQTKGVQQAASDLQKLANAGSSAEQSTGGMASAIDRVNAQMRAMGDKAKGAGQAFKSLDPAAQSLGKIAKESENASGALGKLGNNSSFQKIATGSQDAASGIRKATTELDKFNREANSTEKNAGSMSAAFASMSKVAGGLFAGFSIAQFAGKLVSVQREFDVLNSALITITGSSAKAENELQWIKSFAAETPFSLTEVTQAFIKLKTLGLDASKPSLVSFGNTASAMGKSLNQMIEAVADASTGEFERLKEFGIKAKKNGDEISLTFQGVTTTVKNSAEEISKYLTDIGNNNFAGAMAERAKTLDGAISNLGDSWDELFRTINNNNAGGLIFDSVKLASGAITDIIGVINALNSAYKDSESNSGAFVAAQDGVRSAIKGLALVALAGKQGFIEFGQGIGAAAAALQQLGSGNISGARNVINELIEDIRRGRERYTKEVNAILRVGQYNNDLGALSEGLPTENPKPARTGGGSTGKKSGGGRSVTAKESEEAKAYEQALKAIASAKLSSEKSTLSLTAAESALFDLQKSPVWASMPETWKQTAIEQSKAAAEYERTAMFMKAVEAQEQSNVKQRQGMIEQIQAAEKANEMYGLSASQIETVTQARLEEAIAMASVNGAYPDQIAFMEADLSLRKKLSEQLDKGDLNALLANTKTAKATARAAKVSTLDRALAAGDINQKQYKEAIDGIKDEVDSLDEFTKQAAHNMQDAMADFFINPTKDGMDSLAESFGKTIQKMIVQAGSAQLMNILFGDMGKTGKVSGLAGSALDWLSKAVFSANGNAFAGGETVKKFANGGAFGNGRILTQPTMFAMGGTFGVAGEAGPEGALPLKRMSNGKLGVHMSGGGGMTINQTINAGAGTDKAEVRRAAASGARSVLGVANGARRYG